MSPQAIKMKFTLTDLASNGYAWLATIFSWNVPIDQAGLEFILRVLMTLSAIAVSIVTIYYKVKNSGKDK